MVKGYKEIHDALWLINQKISRAEKELELDQLGHDMVKVFNQWREFEEGAGRGYQTKYLISLEDRFVQVLRNRRSQLTSSAR